MTTFPTAHNKHLMNVGHKMIMNNEMFLKNTSPLRHAKFNNRSGLLMFVGRISQATVYH